MNKRIVFMGDDDSIKFYRTSKKDVSSLYPLNIKMKGKTEDNMNYRVKLNINKAFEDMKKIIHVNEPLKLKRTFVDSEGNECEEIIAKNGMTKCVFENELTGEVEEIVSYVDENEPYDKEKGLMMCMLKYLSDDKPTLYEFFDYWLNDFDRFPSSDKDVTKNISKLNAILQKDKWRMKEDFGLDRARFFKIDRSIINNPNSYMNDVQLGKTIAYSNWENSINKKLKEFKKLSKKYFPNEYKNLDFKIIFGEKECFVRVSYKDKTKVNSPEMKVSVKE